MLRFQKHQVGISEYMSSNVTTVSNETTLPKLVDILHRTGVRHLPVVKGGNPVGIISDRDIKIFLSFAAASSFAAEDIMSVVPYTVNENTPLCEVLQRMAADKLGSAIVVDKENKVVGIFTTFDAVRLLRELVA